MTDVLHVLLAGKHIGTLQRGRLLYDQGYSGTPLSLSMPITQRRWKPPAPRKWVAALLPDRPETLMRWRASYNVTSLDPIELLPHIGEDLAGAAQFVTSERLPAVQSHEESFTPVDQEQISRMLSAVLADLPVQDTAKNGWFSLAGAQAKIALHRLPDNTWAIPSGAMPTTHIIKPAIPGLVDQDIAEAVTMRVAALLGVEVPEVYLETFNDVRTIVVKRYDRENIAGQWQRIHQGCCHGG